MNDVAPASTPTVRRGRALTDPTVAPFSGVIGIEGMLTGDGRLIEEQSLTYAKFPLPLRWAKSDVGGHDGAVIVGRIDGVERADNGDIRSWGVIDLGSEEGREAARLMKGQFLSGVSMDLDAVDSFEADVTYADEEGGEKSQAALVTSQARVRAATLVAIPAFDEARLALVASVGAAPNVLVAAVGHGAFSLTFASVGHAHAAFRAGKRKEKMARAEELAAKTAKFSPRARKLAALRARVEATGLAVTGKSATFASGSWEYQWRAPRQARSLSGQRIGGQWIDMPGLAGQKIADLLQENSGKYPNRDATKVRELARQVDEALDAGDLFTAQDRAADITDIADGFAPKYGYPAGSGDRVDEAMTALEAFGLAQTIPSNEGASQDVVDTGDMEDAGFEEPAPVDDVANGLAALDSVTSNELIPATPAGQLDSDVRAALEGGLDDPQTRSRAADTIDAFLTEYEDLATSDEVSGLQEAAAFLRGDVPTPAPAYTGPVPGSSPANMRRTDGAAEEDEVTTGVRDLPVEPETEDPTALNDEQLTRAVQQGREEIASASSANTPMLEQLWQPFFDEAAGRPGTQYLVPDSPDLDFDDDVDPSDRPEGLPETAEEIIISGVDTGIFADQENQDAMPGYPRDVTFYNDRGEEIGHGYYSDYDGQWHGTWNANTRGEDAVGGHEGWDELGVAIKEDRDRADAGGSRGNPEPDLGDSDAVTPETTRESEDVIEQERSLPSELPAIRSMSDEEIAAELEAGPLEARKIALRRAVAERKSLDEWQPGGSAGSTGTGLPAGARIFNTGMDADSQGVEYIVGADGGLMALDENGSVDYGPLQPTEIGDIGLGEELDGSVIRDLQNGEIVELTRDDGSLVAIVNYNGQLYFGTGEFVEGPAAEEVDDLVEGVDSTEAPAGWTRQPFSDTDPTEIDLHPSGSFVVQLPGGAWVARTRAGDFITADTEEGRFPDRDTAIAAVEEFHAGLNPDGTSAPADLEKAAKAHPEIFSQHADGGRSTFWSPERGDYFTIEKQAGQNTYYILRPTSANGSGKGDYGHFDSLEEAQAAQAGYEKGKAGYQGLVTALDAGRIPEADGDDPGAWLPLWEDTKARMLDGASADDAVEAAIAERYPAEAEEILAEVASAVVPFPGNLSDDRLRFHLEGLRGLRRPTQIQIDELAKAEAEATRRGLAWAAPATAAEPTPPPVRQVTSSADPLTGDLSDVAGGDLIARHRRLLLRGGSGAEIDAIKAEMDARGISSEGFTQPPGASSDPAPAYAPPGTSGEPSIPEINALADRLEDAAENGTTSAEVEGDEKLRVGLLQMERGATREQAARRALLGQEGSPAPASTRGSTAGASTASDMSAWLAERADSSNFDQKERFTEYASVMDTIANGLDSGTLSPEVAFYALDMADDRLGGMGTTDEFVSMIRGLRRQLEDQIDWDTVGETPSRENLTKAAGVAGVDPDELEEYFSGKKTVTFASKAVVPPFGRTLALRAMKTRTAAARFSRPPA